MTCKIEPQGKDLYIMKNQQTAGHLAAIGTVMVWGLTFISTKILLTDFTPIEILFTRFLLGYAALFIIHPQKIQTKDIKKELLFMGAGLCGVTLYFLLENIALTYTMASNVGVIVSIAPMITAIFAHWFLRGEKLRFQFFAGFLLAIGGIFIIGFNGKFNFHLNPIGDILAALAAAVWAAYSVLMKKISAFEYNNIAVTRRVFLYGLIFIIPALFLTDFHPQISQLLQWTNLINILFLGFGASALCFVSWTWVVGVLGAVKASVYIYIVPITTVIASVLILHEPVTPAAIFGVALTLAGLTLSEKKFGKHLNAQNQTDPAE